jgi:hypothetical protein
MLRSLRGLWLVYTALTILLPLSYATQQQRPLRSTTDVAPKRVAVIGRHSRVSSNLQLDKLL